jgi:FkbH-like protein
MWYEVVGLYKTIRQEDSVKMVVVDLDDTLWRGVIADADVGDMPTTEGWPRGLWEALLALKRRGILLGIISKNDEERVREVWDTIFGRHTVKLDDFAAVKINWLPKSENMSEILSLVNLLPRNVVYIDDNPVQREEVLLAHPDLRVLGGTPLLWRHILLWSPETQVQTVTQESSLRTEMIQKQVAREEEKRTTATDQFLNSLGVELRLFEIQSTEHPKFSRTQELVNKTNQFNTSGIRRSFEDYAKLFSSGDKVYSFEVSDRFTDYGLVGVLIVSSAKIDQFVMSCRVMGLEVEIAAVAAVTNIIRRNNYDVISATMVHTDKNSPCRNIYSLCGYTPANGEWRFEPDSEPKLPSHIKLELI